MATCGTVRLIPGPAGNDGADGAAGTDGVDAYTELTAAYTMPAELGEADATVANTDWMTPGQVVYMQGAGWLEVTAITSSTLVTLKNLEDTANDAYTANVAPGTVLASGNKIVASGPQGPAGTDGSSGAPSTASYIVQTPDAGLSGEQALSLLATGLLRSTTGTGVVDIIDIGVSDQSIPRINDAAGLTNGEAIFATAAGIESQSAATARASLGLVIGTDVQAFNALLAALVALNPTAADQLIYSSGVNTLSLATLTAFARSLLDDATAAAARTTLGVLPGYGLLGSIIGWDLNSATTDTAFTIGSARYIIDKVTVDNASANLTTATGGLFTAAGGAGTTIAANQALSALTASSKFDHLTLEAITGTDVFTAGTLYARCGTAQGGAATADIRVFGWKLD